MAKVNTVNVIEYVDDSILSIRAYTDDEQGNKEAETLFKACVEENGDCILSTEMESILEDGYFEQGNYQVFITHSS